MFVPFEEVDAASAPGSGAGARQLGADQGVDHARFANVGAAKECDLRQAGSGELRGIGGRRQEAGENPHAQVCNEGREVGKLGVMMYGCVWGRRFVSGYAFRHSANAA